MRDYVRTSYVARVRVARVMSVSVYDVIIRELLMYRRSLWCRTIAQVYSQQLRKTSFFRELADDDDSCVG